MNKLVFGIKFLGFMNPIIHLAYIALIHLLPSKYAYTTKELLKRIVGMSITLFLSYSAIDFLLHVALKLIQMQVR